MTQLATDNQSPQDDCLFCMEHLYEAALGIVETEDRPRLEHHLADCDVCRAELAGLDATVNLLPLAVEPVAPRPELKRSLRQRMESELRSPQGASIQPLRSPQEITTASPRRPLWTLGTIAAGLLVALLAISAWTFLPVGDDANAPRGQMSVLAMESSDTCEDCHEDTRGHIGADLETTDGMVVAWNLDPGQKHEVWCVNKHGERLKVGDLVVDSSGTVTQTVSFPEAVGNYDQIYVARNDGTEELTVAPNKLKSNGDPAATPPG